MAYVAMFFFIGLMLLGGAEPRLVVIGAGGAVAFAIVVQVIWNAGLRRERSQLAADAARGPENGSGTAPHAGPYRRPTCAGWLCTSDWCAICQDHMCERCNRPLREHPAHVVVVDTPPPPLSVITAAFNELRSNGRLHHNFVCDDGDCVNCRHHDCARCELPLQDHGA
jgi:hypothetical protein